MPSENVTYTLIITAEQDDWIRRHPEIDIPMLLRQTIINQMRKPMQKTASKKKGSGPINKS